jgi:hypothetical protein
VIKGAGLYRGIAIPDTVFMSTSERWISAIKDACAEPDAVRSNRLITKLHYALSNELAVKLGGEGGPNFHTWAVWGSRKAGTTIRQEDLESAIGNATLTAGVVGILIGTATGVLVGRILRWTPDYLTASIGAVLGALTGGWTGRMIAIWSRAKAAKLILLGNQIVIRDIGEQSARFLEMLEGGATPNDRKAFFAGLRRGPTEQLGQDRLATAFRSYLSAFDKNDPEQKRKAMIAGNYEIVYHEHIRLEPYIRGAMPIIVRRCATQRLMTYQIGESVLTVGEDLPGFTTPTAAKDWTNIDDRMRYVFALFQKFHSLPSVFSAPFPETEMGELKTR